ncbi:type IV pilus biogenesis protein PilM [Corallincola spongiicola]|uniref:MSHA biogenesis protein MshI n=1 Tax=Corallincola spongiicola TaxID=2520508 RepID=A0ABY1WNS1_9GAMM|nr:MSHA biogenesis protein MshI [Corallincola spongiicola]TAA45204.1 MSHA biogenesis protein MshI [Corallincola spongiicola]
MPLGRLFGRKASGERIGIRVSNDTLTLCRFRAGAPHTISAESLSYRSDITFEQALATGEALPPNASDCQLVVGPSYYHIVQVDRPAVDDAEIAQALSWAIKDLVPIAPENMILDYFELPVQPAGANKLNVVCADIQVLKPMVDGIHAAKLPLSGIAVDELTLPKLFPVTDEAQLLLVQQANEELLLLIVKQGMLFFSRRIRGYDLLVSMTGEELRAGVVDNLSLEVQRSLDYFESQLRQAPVKQIVVALPGDNTPLLLELMSANFFIPVVTFEPEVAISANLNSGELLSFAGVFAAGMGDE